MPPPPLFCALVGALPAVLGICQTVDLAQGALAAHSASTGSATLAFDGNDDFTRWESAHGVDPQWLAVDLGAVHDGLCSVTIKWEGACASAYRVEGSADGTTWSTLATDGAGGAGVVTTALPYASARHVRMFGTARCLPYGYSVWTMGVFQALYMPPAAPPPSPAAPLPTLPPYPPQMPPPPQPPSVPPRCNSPTCTDAVLATPVSGNVWDTCGGRMQWLQDNLAYTEVQACQRKYSQPLST